MPFWIPAAQAYPSSEAIPISVRQENEIGHRNPDNAVGTSERVSRPSFAGDGLKLFVQELWAASPVDLVM